MTRPSESSLSVSSPHLTTKRYDLIPSWTIGTVLVASPKAIGSTPEASGSSVPAWPAFLALNRYLTCATACVEVSPTGLSRQTQPLTSTRVERRCCFASFAGVGADDCKSRSCAFMGKLILRPHRPAAADRGRLR